MKNLCTIFFILCSALSWSQKVGVVLSGGGASALAHVGFLRALEEHDIPIDYITGTSMGAIIGAMYASGMTVNEIDSIVKSADYKNMTQGELDERYRYFFKEPIPDASMGTIKLGVRSLISTTLPANLINPVLMDYKLMEIFAMPEAAAQYDFDSLYIPFRCVAADIEQKEEVVFDHGHLNVATRASATYPFYLRPIRVNGKLLYDGGLYNNFTVDLMDETFHPDIIIGCNVAGFIDPPSEDDLFSQLENMIRVRVDYTECCEQVLVVEPKTSLGTFDFGRPEEGVEDGYIATIEMMDSIKSVVQRIVTLKEKNIKRAAFRKKFFPLVFDDVSVIGLEKSQRGYVNKLISKKEDSIKIENLKVKYFRTFADDNIKSIFPVVKFNADSKKYKLLLDVKKEKDLFVSFGGNFSSRTINTAYVGLKYNLFRSTSSALFANSYFGKYYGSVHAGLKFNFAGKIPWSLEPEFTFNRWDYFRSFATFFEDTRPSFIVINEQNSRMRLSVPTGSNGVLKLEVNYAQLDYDYYRNETFLSSDTADRTRFITSVADVIWERNTLNRKQFANKGTQLILEAKWVNGEESTLPGNTSLNRDTTLTQHHWVLAKISYTNYFQAVGKMKIGLNLEGLASTQSFFSNYTASIIAAPAYHPIPESQTFFLEQFRAHNYIAGGLMGVLKIHKNVDIRAELHTFIPLGRIVADEFDQAVYDWNFERFFISSAAVVYFSPIGPVSFAVNYYDRKEDPFSFIFNFGYLIYNRSVRD